ncbi:MAG: DNA-methyltransferase [Candidatus Heimdallarchaeota archaeon]
MIKIKTTSKIIIGDSTTMKEIGENEIHLMITSPPYPMIKMWDNIFRSAIPEVKVLEQQMEEETDKSKREKYVYEIYNLFHKYLENVWKETYRVLVDGGIACINIGDATRKINGIFRLFPNHSKIIEICEKIGFITLPYIIWKKPTNKPNAFLGSGFLPTNGYITLDVEYILIFRKNGPRKFPPKDQLRYASKFTKKERDVWFSQTWNIRGEKQNHSEFIRRTAAFPEEIPRRLIRMFSIIGDTVLDPFLGTGTTAKMAMELQRNFIGYEIDEKLKPIIEKRLDINQTTLFKEDEIEINFVKRN